MRLHHLIYPILLLAIGGIFLFGWMSQNPEAEWIERAESWPVVGPLAERFRDAYVGSDPPPWEGEPGGEDSEVEEPIRIVQVAPGSGRSGPSVRPSGTAPGRDTPDAPKRETKTGDDLVYRLEKSGKSREPVPYLEVDRSPPPAAEIIRRISLPGSMSAIESEFRAGDASAIRWSPPGTGLFGEPSSSGRPEIVLSSLSRLPVLGRQGDWIEVGYQGRRHWIGPHSAPPPPGEGSKTKRLMPLKPNDPVLLRKAKKILGLDGPNGEIGPYRLFTDVDDRALLTLLDEAAGEVEDAYLARYGREPSGKARQSVILFADESDYREYYQGRDGFTDGGHAQRSTLAFFMGGRPRSHAVSTLIHEITHLLNRRALAPRLEPWLEEGLADDLGGWHPESAEPPTVETLNQRWGDVVPPGAFTLQYLQDLLTQGELPPLAAVLTLEADDFYVDEKATLHYGMSGYFVRYLMEGEGGSLAPGFKEFLRSIAYNQPANLVELLGRSAPALENGFRRWLAAQETVVPIAAG